MCEIKERNRRTRCESHQIVLKNKTGGFGFRNLKGETKYSFEVYLQSKAKQLGKEKIVFFTTPKYSKFC